MRDLEAIGAALARLSANYRQSLSDAESEVYLMTLLPYGAAAVTAAVDAILHDPDAPGWFPRTQEIIRRITGSRRTRALEAWQKLRTGIQHHAGRTVAFDDPLIHHWVCGFGGWNSLGWRETRVVDALKEEFVTLYVQHLAALPDLSSIPTCLKGEAGIAGDGKVVLIGDPQRAEAVLRGEVSQAMRAITHREVGQFAAIASGVPEMVAIRNHEEKR